MLGFGTTKSPLETARGKLAGLQAEQATDDAKKQKQLEIRQAAEADKRVAIEAEDNANVVQASAAIAAANDIIASVDKRCQSRVVAIAEANQEIRTVEHDLRKEAAEAAVHKAGQSLDRLKALFAEARTIAAELRSVDQEAREMKVPDIDWTYRREPVRIEVIPARTEYIPAQAGGVRLPDTPVHVSERRNMHGGRTLPSLYEAIGALPKVRWGDAR
jgi:hypothetical protein